MRQYLQYGLGPIMKDLGVKLEQELKPGSHVLSNVFSIPGWHPISSEDATHIYVVPNQQRVGPSKEDTTTCDQSQKDLS
jgi:hypothetical protein